MGVKLSLSNDKIADKHNGTTWDRCLELIREKVDAQNYKTWFESSIELPSEANTLMIKVKDEFVVTWLRQHYLPFISSVVSEITTRVDIQIVFVVQDSNNDLKYFKAKEADTNTPVNSNTAPKPQKTEPNNLPQLSPSYTFDRFVVGQFNKMAYSTAKLVASNPGQSGFNPLFIYGGVGLGKTHLLHAIGHEIREKHSKLKVMLITAEGFISNFVSALLNNSINTFMKKYENIDVLLVDDIQFLATKTATQEKFFHLFNSLHHRNMQIVLTSEIQPSKLTGFPERLVSRFNWGMVADLLPPALEDRINILKSKAEYENTLIPNEVLHYLANNISSNIRALEGSMIRLLAQRSVDGSDITISSARNVISHYQSNTSPKMVCIPTIIAKVSAHFKIDESDMLGSRRTKEIAHARQIAMYLARELTDSSLIYIGHAIGGRNHSTVSFAHKKIGKLIEIKPLIQKQISDIRQSCF